MTVALTIYVPDSIEAGSPVEALVRLTGTLTVPSTYDSLFKESD